MGDVAVFIQKILEALIRIALEAPAAEDGVVNKVAVLEHRDIRGRAPFRTCQRIRTVDIVVHVAVRCAEQTCAEEDRAAVAADRYIRPVQSEQKHVCVDRQMQTGDVGCTVLICIVGIVVHAVIGKVDLRQFGELDRYTDQIASVCIQKFSVIGGGDVHGVVYGKHRDRTHGDQHHQRQKQR